MILSIQTLTIFRHLKIYILLVFLLVEALIVIVTSIIILKTTFQSSLKIQQLEQEELAWKQAGKENCSSANTQITQQQLVQAMFQGNCIPTDESQMNPSWQEV